MTNALSIRGERDRFVAFAFASADLLLEVDAQGRVCFAAGAGRRLLGRATEELVSHEFAAFVLPDDRPLVVAVLASIERGGRFAPVLVRLKSDRPSSAILGGCRVPEGSAHYFLSLSAPVRSPARSDAGNGTFNFEGFLQRAQAKMFGGGPAGKMSLIDLDGFGKLSERVPEGVREGLPAALGRQILSASDAVEEVGELARGRYGLLHTGPLDIEGLRQTIQSFTAGVDPAGTGLNLYATSLDLGRGSLSDSDSARALVHAVTQFARSGAAAPSMSSLQESVATLVGKSAESVTLLRSVIVNGSFSIALQPVVDLTTEQPVHSEALARFGEGFAAAEMVTLAEDIGLISEFDLAVCRRVIGILQSQPFVGSIAMNISGRSWSSDAFVSALNEILAPSRVPASGIMFEITETAAISDLPRANRLIQTFRRRGYRFCLDDFGAGASSFHYLRGLEVDYVKIDGQFCREAMNQPRARALLSTVINFCRQNDIGSIGERIETRHQATVLKKLGLRLGQGYFYGRPAIIETGSGALKSRTDGNAPTAQPKERK